MAQAGSMMVCLKSCMSATSSGHIMMTCQRRSLLSLIIHPGEITQQMQTKNGVNDSYDKLIHACQYDPRGAFMAVSMGAFQVMGEHYVQMGYKTPWEMLYACTHTEKAQYDLLVSFIEMNRGQSKFLALSEKTRCLSSFCPNVQW